MAAAEPPLEPPAVRSGFQGFRVGPNRRGSVDAPMANSGRFVFSDDDKARALQPPDELAVLIGHIILQEGRAFREANARVFRDEILEQERNALERAGRDFPFRCRASQIVHRGDDRVEPGVQAFHAINGRVHKVAGFDLLTANQLGLGRGIQEGEIIHRGVRHVRS